MRFQNKQINISEENAYNYLVKNITNPIDIIIDGLVGNKDHKEINPSGIRISSSGILDEDCMNQEINDNGRSDQKFYIGLSKSISSIPNPISRNKYHHRNNNIR